MAKSIKVTVKFEEDSPLFEILKQIGSFFDDAPAPDLEWLNVRYGIFRDLHLKSDGTIRAGYYMITAFPGDNVFKLLAALRTGELSASALYADFCHDESPTFFKEK